MWAHGKKAYSGSGRPENQIIVLAEPGPPHPGKKEKNCIAEGTEDPENPGENGKRGSASR